MNPLGKPVGVCPLSSWGRDVVALVLVQFLSVSNSVARFVFGHGGFARDGGVECCCEPVAEVLCGQCTEGLLGDRAAQQGFDVVTVSVGLVDEVCQGWPVGFTE